MSNRRPNANPTPGGHLECTACRSPFLFYDRLRHVAVARLDEDPTRQAEIADVLLTVRQCERCTFRYMAHVMLAVQQAHKMKQAVSEMDSSTAYMVLDFKQKFLAKGFREGGDSYYSKKGMLWWGAGVYVKSDTGQDDRSTEFIEEHHVEIDFTAEKVRLRQQVEMVNKGNVQDDDDEDVVDDDSEEDSVEDGEEEGGVWEGEEDHGEEGVEEDGVGRLRRTMVWKRVWRKMV